MTLPRVNINGRVCDIRTHGLRPTKYYGQLSSVGLISLEQKETNRDGIECDERTIQRSQRAEWLTDPKRGRLGKAQWAQLSASAFAS